MGQAGSSNAYFHVTSMGGERGGDREYEYVCVKVC